MIHALFAFRYVYILVLFNFFYTSNVDAQNLKNELPSTQVLVLDLRKALNESNSGQAILANYRDSIVTLNDEFMVIESQLIAEEKRLLEIKPTMQAPVFLKLAQAFDEKSTETRELYRSKKKEIDENLNTEMERLALVLSQIAGTVMEEKGALLVMMKNQVIVSSNKIDITSEVMDRANKTIELGRVLATD